MYHFRDQIRCGNPAAFFVINGDVCGDFPLLEMCQYYRQKEALVVVAGTEATRNQSVNYGTLALRSAAFLFSIRSTYVEINIYLIL